MKCPKCSAENPNDAQTCNLCGQILKNDSSGKPCIKLKTSRLAILSFILSIFSLLFSILTAIPAIILAIVSLVKITKSKGRLKGKAFAIASIIISVLLSFTLVLWFLWSFDADPVPNDYTTADFRSAPLEYSHSYELLRSLSEKEENETGELVIGLSEQDMLLLYEISDTIDEDDYSKIANMLNENADKIEQAWTNAKKGRDVIDQLSIFPEIADLTEPDWDAEMLPLSNLMHLARLYQAYVYLQTEQGKAQIAVNELIKLHSVFRKLSINARWTVTKLVYFKGLDIGISAANFIVNNPKTSREPLQLLSEHFTPLSDEQLSLRNTLISEYLMFKKILDISPSKDYSLRETLFLKRNSTLRLYKNLCDRWVAVWEESGESEKAKLLVWPSIYPDWLPSVSVDSEGRLPRYYTCYNPIGSLLIQILTPARVFEMKTKMKVRDDLFQIVLNKRLGKKISLKARAYSDNHIIDTANKRIFSPGPDGKAHTEDDIKLPINPEVLNLTD